MNLVGRIITCSSILILSVSGVQAAPFFGAMTGGDNLEPRLFEEDGGAGFLSSSSSAVAASGDRFSASANFVDGSTFLPELGASATSTLRENDDDKTAGRAEAYRVFTAAPGELIQLDVMLDGDIFDSTPDSRSTALADVFVYGGPNFEVVDGSQCSDGSFNSKFLFDGTYFCGSRLERANLFIAGDGENQQLTDTLSFFASGGSFGVLATLSVVARDGEADFSQTLGLRFQDDSFITPLGVEPPSAIPVPAAVWLFATALIGLAGFSKRKIISKQG